MKKINFLFFFFLALSMFSGQVFSQTLSEDYDKKDIVIDPFEKEDKEIHEKRIKEILARVRRGDATVFRLIVFGTFEKFHDYAVKGSKQSQQSYFEFIGGESALPAIVGGFDNQDPKVRLKCIGFLGYWVEEIGKNTSYIDSVVSNRLSTNIETRSEVRYGYHLLKMKITRKKVIESLKNGDLKVLVQISPEEFLPLVYYEPRIRTIYLGSSASVKIRSIVLDPGIEPETGRLIGNEQGRDPNVDIEKICYKGMVSSSYQSEVAQWMNTNTANSLAQANTAAPSESQNYVKNEAIPAGANLNWDCAKAILNGVDNKSQFIRENALRIFLNYTRGYTGNPNYPGSVKRKARVFSQELSKIAQDPNFVRMVQVAWHNTKWSEYYYNDRVFSSTDPMPFVKSKFYLEYQEEGNVSSDYNPAKTKRYFTDDSNSYPEWGTEKTGNYRNDLKELGRILALEHIFDAEYVPKETVVEYYQSRVTTLFNDGEGSAPDQEDVLQGEQVEMPNETQAKTDAIQNKSSAKPSDQKAQEAEKEDMEDDASLDEDFDTSEN